MSDEDWNVTMRIGVPFVVTSSAGGPFEDRAFIAGYQMGRIEEGMRLAEDTGATMVKFLRVNRLLVRQVEAHGQVHGFEVQDVVGDLLSTLVDITLRPIPGGAS